MANNAHSNIDSLISIDDLANQIDPSTIREVRAGPSPFALSRNALYNALTKGGEKREIFRQGYPSHEDDDKDRRLEMLHNVIKEFTQNPASPDTVTAETRPGIKAELDYSGKPLKYLKCLLTR